MNVDLKNKVIVISGSSKGIGRELARTFAYEGTSVVINYLHSETEAIELYREISNNNSNCLLVKADVTNYNDVINMYHEVYNKYGRIDVLINNAGKCDDLIQFMSEEKWNRIVDVNLTGTFLCCKAFMKMMVKQNSGKIFNISSLKGQEGCEGQTNYSVSKAGLIGFTKALAKEAGQFNISVNAICPGFIVTDLNRHNHEKVSIAQNKSVLDISNALSDFVNFMMMMCSDKIQGISGRVFNLDSRIL